jgi:hypothetical protein
VIPRPILHEPTWAIPQPEILRRCVRCLRAVTLPNGKLERGADEAFTVISPSGIAHIGEDYGATACGIDATGETWWWRL